MRLFLLPGTEYNYFLPSLSPRSGAMTQSVEERGGVKLRQAVVNKAVKYFCLSGSLRYFVQNLLQRFEKTVSCEKRPFPNVACS